MVRTRAAFSTRVTRILGRTELRTLAKLRIRSERIGGYMPVLPRRGECRPARNPLNASRMVRCSVT